MCKVCIKINAINFSIWTLSQAPHNHVVISLMVNIFLITVLIILFLQTQVDSNQFVSFFCEHVLPQWDAIITAEEGPDSKLELLKILAEVTEHCSDLEEPQKKIDAVYDVVIVCCTFYYTCHSDYVKNMWHKSQYITN